MARSGSCNVPAARKASDTASKTLLYLLCACVLVLPALAENPNRQWAEAMLEMRHEYRAKNAPNANQKRTAGKTLARSLFKEMLVRFPYQTDWLLQDCDNDPEPWLRQTGEPTIERSLLAGISVKTASFGDTEDPRWLERFAVAAEARRTERLAELKARCPKIVFTRNHDIQPSFFAYTEGQSDAQAERHFTPGSALCLLEWDESHARTRDLLDDPHGRIRDPEVSFDGKKVLFSWKKSNRLDDYHLYELTVDSGRIRQLTFGLGVADFEPCYVPNGDIVFSSSRCVQTIDCWMTETSNLYTCGPDGQHLRRLGYDQVHTVKPALLPNGKVVYTRWDYNDRGQVYPQGLFEMNPDGTAQTEYYGNNSWFPTTISHARGIEGTDKVIAIAMGHHTWQAGKLILLDNSKGRQENSGVQLVAPIRETPAVRVDRYGQNGDLFQYPFALNEREFLVAYSPLGGRPGRFSIYYMDIDGNRELLASDPKISCQHPAPLAPRKLPPARPSLVDYTQDTGAFYMQDVYAGPGLKGVERGTIKKLRVVELEFRAAQVGCNFSAGPGGSARASTPVSVGNGSWDVKRVLGDATVHPDGSALFEVPAHRPVFFQCLDDHNRTVQTMRSWATLQPGETFSCVGCHENKNTTPRASDKSLAFEAGKERLQPFHGKPRGFSFLKEVQPILDAKCVDCHQKEKQVDLSADPVHDPVAKRTWTRSYLNLTEASPVRQGKDKNATPGAYRGKDESGRVVWVSAQSVPDMIAPYSVGSTVSPLADLLLEGHGDLNRQELDKIFAWIDLAVPFGGDYYEGNAWTEAEASRYDRYQAKREVLAELDAQNIRALLAGDHSVKQPHDIYRNVAPEAKVTSNSVCRNLEEFAAANVIDGKHENAGHGKQFPSWGPDRRDDLWLQLDWEEDMFIDRINVSIRADFQNGHDSWWRSGVIELSNGAKVPFTLAKTADVQTIPLPVKEWPPSPVRWLKFSSLVPAEDKWCGFAEVEVMGRSAQSPILVMEAKPAGP